MPVRNRFAELLGKEMVKQRRQISVAEVADAIGVTRQGLHRIVNHEVRYYSVDMIEKLCKYFNCTVGDLLTIVDELPEANP